MKKQTIRIHRGQCDKEGKPIADGWAEREGYILSEHFSAWRAYQSRTVASWSITHIPTGFTTGYAWTLKRAAEAAREYEAAPVDWDAVDRPVCDEIKRNHDLLHAISERYARWL